MEGVVSSLPLRADGVDRPARENSANPIFATLTAECEAMLRFALEHQHPLSADLIHRASQVLACDPESFSSPQCLEGLVSVHAALSATVAPASGQTLVLLEAERKAHPTLFIFGPVRLIRQMLALALAALLVTGVLSTSVHVNTENIASGWFGLDGFDAACVLAFILAVATLGAAFASLAAANRYVERANYDPKYEGSYWARVVLGLISGVVLAEMLFDLVERNGGAGGGLAAASMRVVLAFSGGFASSVVQLILTNLLHAFAALFSGRGGAKDADAPNAKSPRAAPATVEAES